MYMSSIDKKTFPFFGVIVLVEDELPNHLLKGVFGAPDVKCESITWKAVERDGHEHHCTAQGTTLSNGTPKRSGNGSDSFQPHAKRGFIHKELKNTFIVRVGHFVKLQICDIAIWGSSTMVFGWKKEDIRHIYCH